MRFVLPVRIWLGIPALFALSEVVPSVLAADTPLTADQVIAKAVVRSQRVQSKSSQPVYTYTKVTVTEELDSAGKVKERKEKAYRVFFEGGSTRLKLVEVNGHPANEADLKKQADNESNLRQIGGSSKSAKGDARENLLTPELVSRFSFKLLGQTQLNGRNAYQIAFQPKSPEPPVRRMVDRLLNRISGTIWIDADEFEIARADVRLGSEVDLLGGVVGSLKKLAYTMTRTRVADGVWLNSFSSGDFEGRKLLDWMRIKTRSQSGNFRLLRVTS